MIRRPPRPKERRCCVVYQEVRYERVEGVGVKLRLSQPSNGLEAALACGAVVVDAWCGASMIGC